MSLYETLGLEKGADDATIKKAYRKLVMKHHPDKGGDPETFKKIQHAYDILSEPDKKQMYDMTGSETDQGPNIGDLFKNMFGGGQPQGPRKRPDTDHVIRLSLDDAYKGTKKTLRVDLQKYCPKCLNKCTQCNGSGGMMHRIGPIAMQQPCGTCQGTGFRVLDSCKECTVSETVTVNINPGVSTGASYVIKGMGDQARGPHEQPGNLNIMIRVLEHSLFRREGYNLIFKQQITFVESVHGTIINIPHFESNIVVNVDTKEWGAIDPRKRYIIKDKGMPGGDLYIEFDIIYDNKKYTLVQDE
jgi:DnaJ-class molecular chaperone